jgi:hypothetical protein
MIDSKLFPIVVKYEDKDDPTIVHRPDDLKKWKRFKLLLTLLSFAQCSFHMDRKMGAQRLTASWKRLRDSEKSMYIDEARHYFNDGFNGNIGWPLFILDHIRRAENSRPYS